MDTNTDLTERLWVAASDLLAILEQQKYDKIKYQGKPYGESASYQQAISTMQEAEKELFGKSITLPHPKAEARAKRVNCP